MMIIYMLFEAHKAKKRLIFGHEASLVCVIGVCISGLFMYKGTSEFGDLMAFNNDLFFYFVLPPIVFASGFNMYRKKFFANIGNIILLGVVGTFIFFAVFCSLTMLLVSNMTLTTYTNAKTGEW